jgi:PAT family beta-lactamase induction signal transducer AmpG
LLLALLLTSGAVLGFALLPSPAVAWGVVALFGLAFGFYETVYMAMGMGFSDPRIAAFTFSLIMAVGNTGIALGQPLSGVLVDEVGFRWMFAVLAGLNLATLPLVFALFSLRRDVREQG